MSSEATDLYALLIGIDRYDSQRVQGKVFYHNLNGSVNGAAMVEELLINMLGERRCDIRKLLTPKLGFDVGDSPLPTYENIVREIQRLTRDAEPGKQVLIYYCGHGGRAITKYPEVKGEGKHCYDEVLVPTDIGHTEDRYLRDLELAQLISDMVKKDLYLTLVIDSCHSGGATRETGTMVPHGIGVVDRVPRSDLSLVAPPEKLQETWRKLLGKRKRKVFTATGWLPEPRGYVLMAACGENERAWTKLIDGRACGVFTHWFIDSLKRSRPGWRYRHLYDRVKAKVHTMLPGQTPQLEGERYRAVLGTDTDFRSGETEDQEGVNVLEVDHEGGRVLLNTGRVHAVCDGAQLAVYQPTASIVRGQLEAVVEVVETTATESWARISEQPGKRGVHAGDQAYLLSRPIHLKLRVLLDEQTSTDRQDAFALVRKVFEQEGNGNIMLVSEDQEPELQVAVTEDDHYEILDAAGVKLQNLNRRLPIGLDGAVSLLRRLEHLAKYWNIRRVDNPDATSPIAGMLQVDLCRWPDGCKSTERPWYLPLATPGGKVEVRSGELLCLWITNSSSKALNVTIIDLQPDWGVDQICERVLRPGQQEPIQLKAYLPPGLQRGTDLLKVIGTVGHTSFQWLYLPAIGKPADRHPKATVRSPGNALEELQKALMIHAPRETVSTSVTRSAAKFEWVVADIEISVVDREIYDQEQEDDQVTW
jgi:hypothetical protein